MYVRTKHAKGVSSKTLIKGFYYSVFRKFGFLAKLRERFGSSAQLHLNSELALTLILRNLPERVPGKTVLVDYRLRKRFKKVVERLGLSIKTYSGGESLADKCDDPRLLAVLIPDHYSGINDIVRSKLGRCLAYKIVYQNRSRPKSVNLEHDIYIWEPRNLPRAVSGAVTVFASDRVSDVRDEVLRISNEKARLKNGEFLQSIRWSLSGFEDRFRRIDRRPPRILARILYDFYK